MPPAATTIPEGLKSVVRKASLLRFRQHCLCDDVELVEAENPGSLVFAHWMGLILVANVSVRIMLKAHYNSTDIRKIATAPLEGEGGAAASNELIADFMREYCNLMGGAIKAAVETSGVPVGVSLPLVTRGFDEVFSHRGEGSRIAGDAWTLVRGASKVHCSLEMELTDREVFGKLDAIRDEAEIQEEGDVEFL